MGDDQEVHRFFDDLSCPFVRVLDFLFEDDLIDVGVEDVEP